VLIRGQSLPEVRTQYPDQIIGNLTPTFLQKSSFLQPFQTARMHAEIQAGAPRKSRTNPNRPLPLFLQTKEQVAVIQTPANQTTPEFGPHTLGIAHFFLSSLLHFHFLFPQLALGQNIKMAIGQVRGQTDVLTFATDGQGKLIVGHNDQGIIFFAF
jgi:hypothetical protein